LPKSAKEKSEDTMSRKCDLTGVRPLVGHLVSHSNIKTKTRQMGNLKKRRYLVAELGRTIQVRLSARAMRTVDKQGGIARAVLQAKEGNLSQALQGLRRELIKLKSQ
jgi:large subunit ribosomal protein L28